MQMRPAAMPTVTITEIETGKRIYTGYYADLSHVWPMASPVVAEWFEVFVDDVDLVETDCGDMISVEGKIVATINHEYRRAELRRPIYAEAAE
jgi:hypothetical protein